MAPWWKGAVVYHIYVRSFFDSDGDGHGDLAGVMAKLDYLKSLGVDAVWLSPIHPSPNRDWGYDVSDYDDVHPDYGSLEDFQALTEAAHRRGLKVLLDGVLAHTSDEHPWFAASRDEGPEGDKADWYVWADPADDGTAPNNWLSVFGGPAWAYQPARRQHYHHKFLRQQPKLNWRQPQAKAAALKVLDTWLARGADGFRLDVANALLHDGPLRDNPAIPAADRDRGAWAHASDMQRHLFDANLPETIPLLDEIRRRVEAHGGERFVFGEFSEEEARCGAYCAPDQGLHSAYTFTLLKARRMTAQMVKDHCASLAAYPAHWPMIAFCNHDVPRTVTRLGGPEAGAPAARLMLALQMALRGSVLLYQGEELGLPEAEVSRNELRDPVGDLYWPVAWGRDGARTPMPWRSDAVHLGFSNGAAWLPAAESHRALAVDRQELDPKSTLAFARQMITLRKASRALTLGDIEILDTQEPVLAFLRQHEGQTIACVFNMSERTARAEHPALCGGEILPVASGASESLPGGLALGPYACRFIKRP